MSHDWKYSARVNWNSSCDRSLYVTIKPRFKILKRKKEIKYLTKIPYKEDRKKIKSPNPLRKRFVFALFNFCKEITDLLLIN